MTEFLVIGSGISGIISAMILGEDYKTEIIEKNPISSIGEDIWIILNEYSTRDLRSLGWLQGDSDVVYFDEVQVHDIDGKTIAEYSFPLVAVKLRAIHEEALRNTENYEIKDKLKATTIMEKGGLIKKIKIEGKKHDVYSPSFIIDASGYFIFISRKNVIKEQHYLYRHNIYNFFQATLLDVYSNQDKSVLHLTICDAYTPGGFAFTFFHNDKAYICGFHNNYLTDIQLNRRANLIKNSLGIIGLLSKVKSKVIPLCHPLMDISYENAFFTGAATLTVYPLFISGIPHSMTMARDLSKNLIKTISENEDIKNTGLLYSKLYIQQHIYRGILNDILRLLLLSIRSHEIEEAASSILEVMKVFSKHEEIMPSLLNMADLATHLLSKMSLTRIIQRLVGIIVQFYKSFRDMPTDKDNLNTRAKDYNTHYTKRVKDIINSELLRKVSIGEILKKMD